MDLIEARAVVNDERLWPLVRDAFLASGEFKTYPKGDLRRIELLDEETRAAIDRWVFALGHAEEWKRILDGEGVRRLKADYPGVYPEVFRLVPYFLRFSAQGIEGNPEAMKLLLKLKFPEAYEICCS